MPAANRAAWVPPRSLVPITRVEIPPRGGNCMPRTAGLSKSHDGAACQPSRCQSRIRSARSSSPGQGRSHRETRQFRLPFSGAPKAGSPCHGPHPEPLGREAQDRRTVDRVCHQFDIEPLWGAGVRPVSGPMSPRKRPWRTISGRDLRFLRKEVIQPQVPLRLPCYDLVPIRSFTFGACSCEHQRLRVPPPLVA